MENDERQVPPPEASKLTAAESSRATLRIEGPTLEPDQVTRQLKVEPTRVRRAGEPPVPGAPAASPGSWVLSVDSAPAAAPDACLRELLDRLDAARSEWLEVVRMHAVSLSLSPSGQALRAGFALSPELLGRVAELGVELDFDAFPEGS